MDHEKSVHDESIEPGNPVYDRNGRLLGRVSGFTDDGFETEMIDPDANDTEEIPGQEFGEGYLMWRCHDCGKMDELEDGMPESCPACGAPKEALSAVQED